MSNLRDLHSRIADNRLHSNDNSTEKAPARWEICSPDLEGHPPPLQFILCEEDSDSRLYAHCSQLLADSNVSLQVLPQHMGPPDDLYPNRSSLPLELVLVLAIPSTNW